MKISYKNEINDLIKFCEEKQIFQPTLWEKFTDVYKLKADEADNGWRSEYFGKTMRGACSIYKVSPSAKLYEALYSAVKNFLTARDEKGRFTSYVDEFKGWDVWGRKYVISSLLEFYEICKDVDFKNEVLSAVKKHADYIIEKIGDKEGQIGILRTSDAWGGLNSASIAETFIHLYVITNESKYLGFAEYVISTGGCMYGNLVETARENKLAPHDYPVNKAYETISFFESLLDYYSVTKKQEYLNIFTDFIENVRDNEITVIGCAGCTDELFDNSYVKQTEPSETYMQETCVAVTWMRVLSKYYSVTKKSWCLNEIEKSFLNDYLGAVNDKENRGFSYFDKEYVEVLPFDSYSPLYKSRRGIAVGGFKNLPGGGHYGCCVAISASGLSAYLENVVKKENDGSISVNYIIPLTLNDGETTVTVSGACYKDERATVTVSAKPVNLNLRTSGVSEVFVNGEKASVTGEYVKLSGFIGKITVVFDRSIKTVELNGKICYKSGALVLAQDEAIAPIRSVADKIESVEYLPDEYALIRVKINGIDFIDYAHAGKVWNEKNITVWNDKRS